MTPIILMDGECIRVVSKEYWTGSRCDMFVCKIYLAIRNATYKVRTIRQRSS